MKLECTRKEFSEALNLAGMATSQRTSLPILKTVLLEAGESKLRIVGCDGEMWAERTILARVPSPGSICVSFGLLKDLVAQLPDGTVALEVERETLFLRTDGSEWRLLALPGEDYPVAPTIEGTGELRLPMGELRSGVDSVSYAVADDNSRPVLTGVLFVNDGEKLTLVATDSHRLAITTLSKPGIGSDVHAIVPAKALKAIKELPFGNEDEVTVKFDENRIMVDAGEARVVSQLLVGAFPNWERVVPSSHTRTWTLDRTEVIENVKRAMILARDSANRVRFTGHGDQILISARSEDKGEAKEEIPAVVNNGDIDIAFNGRYVLEALTAMKGDGVRAELTESIRPAIFRPVDHNDHMCVIMPMQLS